MPYFCESGCGRLVQPRSKDPDVCSYERAWYGLQFSCCQCVRYTWHEYSRYACGQCKQRALSREPPRLKADFFIPDMNVTRTLSSASIMSETEEYVESLFDDVHDLSSSGSGSSSEKGARQQESMETSVDVSPQGSPIAFDTEIEECDKSETYIVPRKKSVDPKTKMPRLKLSRSSS
ncbi:hypothetical protein GUITHDRAFT_117073 [Guillardia theta CCMP2712]|uniref:Uncharacterized protein n=1 Tax=Guillardia theta (strain CCMP2712) TaxID=905079 RepID=L1IKZ3_GUITC|nr:hypothetical protein GUITHDRAFT_117073 [Guillardia theta CCMP2712]EKX36777.1 hypothetical protein GUITHDRAFT_117073 [Guillardia theta CCMP2712]|eukprot:XP_005823757.1 hypothetical protein GUITHDRAFT_117073 [Guillardia theta CCMP2712]